MAKETHNGDLRTPVTFFSTTIKDGVDGRDVSFKDEYMTFAEIYNPSMKDIEIASGRGVKSSLTLRIRDPLTSYIPDNKHVVEISDHRYKGVKWKIVDIRPDFKERQFLTIVLGGEEHG